MVFSVSMQATALCVLFLLAPGAFAQAPAESVPSATMKQLMVDLIHPAFNDILLFVNRGSASDEKEWAAVRRSAVTLAESANLLMARGRARDQGDWMKDAKMLGDVGTAAYKAAQSKDAKALAALAEPLDASCTACHKQYRPNVFPRDGGSK
jgi:cytochrome c556